MWKPKLFSTIRQSDTFFLSVNIVFFVQNIWAQYINKEEK